MLTGPIEQPSDNLYKLAVLSRVIKATENFDYSPLDRNTQAGISAKGSDSIWVKSNNQLALVDTHVYKSISTKLSYDYLVPVDPDHALVHCTDILDDTVTKKAKHHVLLVNRHNDSKIITSYDSSKEESTSHDKFIVNIGRIEEGENSKPEYWIHSSNGNQLGVIKKQTGSCGFEKVLGKVEGLNLDPSERIIKIQGTSIESLFLILSK